MTQDNYHYRAAGHIPEETMIAVENGLAKPTSNFDEAVWQTPSGTTYEEGDDVYIPAVKPPNDGPPVDNPLPLPHADEILLNANRIINGPRQESYGHPSKNFGDIAAVWSVLLDKEITARDVAKLMVALKLCRDKNGRGDYDSLLDSIGYLALAHEVSQ